MFDRLRANAADLRQDVCDIASALHRLDDDTELTLMGHLTRGLKNVSQAAYIRLRHGKQAVDSLPDLPTDA